MRSNVELRDVTEDDLPIFFQHQLDPDANRMADFPARDREAFMAHWKKIMSDETNILKTILLDGQVAGNVVSWIQSGEQKIGYWIGKAYWGRGVASQGVSQFLTLVKARPLYAHVAKHNVASLRVLEKCGFKIAGEEVGEWILRLAANEGDAV